MHDWPWLLGICLAAGTFVALVVRAWLAYRR